MELEGPKELMRQLQEMSRALDPQDSEPVIYHAADLVTNVARILAPGPSKAEKKRGYVHLKQAFRTVLLRRYGNDPAPAIAAVDRKKAPHAHLVEFGTGERIATKGDPSRRGRGFGVMPARPFLRPAWQQTKRAVLAYIVTGFKLLIQRKAAMHG
jgi:HK97 gp10 family phage protein